MPRPVRLLLALVAGLALGVIIALVLRPVVLGVIAGVITMVRIDDIVGWRKGALYGALLGFFIGALMVERVVVSGATPSDMLSTGFAGAVTGALAGGIMSHIRKRRITWFS